MSQKFHNIEIDVGESLEEKLQWLAPNYSQFRILKKSVDARRSQKPHFIYSVEVFAAGESPQTENFQLTPLTTPPKERPIIIGAGPAGLFCALRLVERGIKPILLERGSEAAKRMLSINRYWRYGQLDLDNNVCFGEGGAGLYSDGKLITRIKSPHIPYVLNRLVQFGAPAEIQYLSNPHVGSDRIRRVIPKLREYLLAHGCEIHFDTAVEELIVANSQVRGVRVRGGREFLAEHVVLAPGHSATDLLYRIHHQGVATEGKSFAMGLRIEHPQKLINKIQYRDLAEHPELGAANYRLAHHDSQAGIGVYSFCMCPGGYILSSGTDVNGLVCNGMSNYNRGSPFANAAIVVSVDHHKLFGDDLFGGMKFRAELESSAYQAITQQGGTKQLPAQTLMDFMERKSGTVLPTSSPSGVLPVRLDQLLPPWMYARLAKSLEEFDIKMGGFLSPEAQLHGMETRTSCPLRFLRDAGSLQSISHKGLYPTGEGAGYAGGITSAACDGIRVAEKIFEEFCSQKTELAISKNVGH